MKCASKRVQAICAMGRWQENQGKRYELSIKVRVSRGRGVESKVGVTQSYLSKLAPFCNKKFPRAKCQRAGSAATAALLRESVDESVQVCFLDSTCWHQNTSASSEFFNPSETAHARTSGHYVCHASVLTLRPDGSGSCFQVHPAKLDAWGIHQATSGGSSFNFCVLLKGCTCLRLCFAQPGWWTPNAPSAELLMLRACGLVDVLAPCVELQ